MAQASLKRIPVGSLFQRACVALVALSLAANSSVAFSSSGAAEPSLQTQLAELDKLRRFATDIRGTLDKSQFDLEALLDRLDYDSIQIFDFVQNSISFEQYPGLLRGARGTLVSRSGNALDQALLLARLLKDAGYDARIARGELDPEQANSLLKEMRRPRRPTPAMGDAEAAFQVYLRHGVLQAGDLPGKTAIQQMFRSGQAPSAEALAETDRIATFIKEQLAESKVAPGSADLDHVLLEEAQDYFWVQFRETAAGTWQDLHPAFGDGANPGVVAFTTVYGGSVPDELQHRLRIQFYAERWRDGRLETFPVSDPWERPVANLLGLPLTAGVLPNTLLQAANTAVDLDQAIAEASYFVPVLMDEVAPGAVLFDRYGNQLDAMAMQHPSADLFGTLQNVLGGAIGQLDSGKSLPSVTAHWIELTLVAPGGKQQQYRRGSFDRIGAAARMGGQTPDRLDQATPGELRAMLERQTIMVDVGETSHAMAMDQSLGQMLDGVALVQMITKALYQSGKIIVPPSAAGISSAWSGQLTLFASLDQARWLSDRHRIYRSAPALVIHRAALLPGSGLAEGIDIVANPRRAIPLQGPLRLDPGMLISVGVWETQMEGTVVNQQGPLLNTMHAFEQAHAKGSGFKLLLPGQSPAGLLVSQDAKQHILRDLEQGFAVLVPSSEAGLTQLGWWRINVDTGETLGMLSDGRGSVISEFLVTYSSAISQAFLVVGLMGCLKQAHETGNQPGGLGRAVCCVGSNLVFFGIGWLGGNVVAGASSFKMSVELGSAAKAYLAQSSVLFDSVTSMVSICH